MDQETGMMEETGMSKENKISKNGKIDRERDRKLVSDLEKRIRSLKQRLLDLKMKLSFQFLNLPLRLKLFGIVLLSLALLAGTSVIGIRRLRRQYDLHLYNAYQMILSVSVNAFSDALDNTTDYIKTVATDSTIQGNLAQIKDNPYLPGTKVRSLEKELQRFLNDELNQTLYALTVCTDKGAFYNSTYKYDYGYDVSLGTKFSTQELQDITAMAPENKTMWLTDYSNSYGLVVVQNVRRIAPMRLDSLGILIGCLNLQPVIHNCTAQLQQEECYFALLDSKGNNFYTYNNLDREIDFLDKIGEDKEYTVMRRRNGCYFVIRGSIDSYNWDYLYAIPYDAVESAMRNGYRNIVLALILCIAIAVCASMGLIRQILRDFDKLMLMIRNASHADFGSVELASEDTGRSDEVGVLIQQFTRMSDKIDRLIQDNYESRLLAQEAKLRALEMQINPHFLYNTLESVRCCAKLGQNEDVCSIVESLGNIMHLIMSEHNNELKLRQELELIDDYIRIQKLRFDQRLEFCRQVDEECCNAVLPKLTIMPLVENAVVHGVENCPNTCHIMLIVRREGEQVRIQIKNTGTSFAENFLEKLKNNEITPTRHGIGLLNVDSRLKIFFKTGYRIEFYNEDGLAVADVTIPYWAVRNHEKEVEYD